MIEHQASGRREEPPLPQEASSATATRFGMAKTLVVSLGGAAYGALAAFAIAAIIARFQGPEGSGIFFQFVAVFTITVAVLKLGTDTSMVRWSSQLVAVHRSELIHVVLRIALQPVIIVGLAVVAVLEVLAPSLAEILVADPTQVGTAVVLIRILAPLALVSALFYLILGALRGTGSVWAFVTLLNVALPSARIVLIVIALALGASAAAAVVAWAGSLPVWCLLAIVVLRRRLTRLRTADVERNEGSPLSAETTGEALAQRRPFWIFSIGRWAAATVEIVLEWVDVLLVGALLSPAAAGVYAIATRVIRAGQVVDNAMRVAVGPRISAGIVLGDYASVRDLHRTASQAMLVLTLPYYVTCLVFAEAILGLFGPEFAVEGATALRILAIGITISAATIMSQSVVLLAGRSHWQLRNKLVALTIVVVGNLLLLPKLGIAGAAIAWTLGVSADAFLVTRQSRRLVRGGPGLGTVVKPLLTVGLGVALIGIVVRLAIGSGTVPLAVHLAIVAVAYVVGVLLARRAYGFRFSDFVKRDASG